MRIKSLSLDNFGPFRRYDIPFVEEEPVCLLITGRNNEGKSNIILALRLLASACRSVGRLQTRIVLDGNSYYRLPQTDVENINIGRILHNYTGNYAKVMAEFEKDFWVTVILDEAEDLIYAGYEGLIPADAANIFGFIPPLGPLAEEELFLTLKYLRSNINTSLAPRHLRNYLAQILTLEEYALIQDIVHRSWTDIELLDYEHNYEENTLTCFFREGKIERELAWAGQGLQVWFQIITHLVRLRHTSILVLDEPEINLHAEKQIELVRILKEQHSGSTIIATHSVELMNSVNVSHITHIQKSQRRPRIKSTEDRAYLNFVRSQIGSNFNLIASQFESFDVIIFTEDSGDFSVLDELANKLGIRKKAFNIPLHGFSEYPKALHYRDAYKQLIGGNIKYSILLDRDYYPEEHLKQVMEKLKEGGVRALFTPGKEIENIFFTPAVLKSFIPSELLDEFTSFWEEVCASEKLDCYSSYLTLHRHFLPAKIDVKTLTKKYTPLFEAVWVDPNRKHLLLGGKKVLQRVRGFFREKTGNNLTSQVLIRALIDGNRDETQDLVAQLYHEAPYVRQVLYY